VWANTSRFVSFAAFCENGFENSGASGGDESKASAVAPSTV
jgi:hypothetical protein